MDLSLVIPTYNEKDSIGLLIESIFKQFEENKIKGEIIVVDDNSLDGTIGILENLKKRFENLKVIHRPRKLGLSSAVLDGFSIAKGNVFGVMDADFSHPVEKIGEMYNIIKKSSSDFVIGSRYVKGGKIERWNTYRKVLSKGATLLARFFTNVKDPLSGFFMIKKDCVDGKRLDSKGFKILLEIIMKTDYKNIKEIPITFVNRTKGKSKAGIKEIFYYLWNLVHYLPYKKNLGKEFLKFAFVGFIGMIINISLLYFLTEFLRIYYITSAVFSFLLAVSNNFILNKVWTFKEKITKRFFRKYIKFFFVSITTLFINLLLLYFFTEVLGIYYLLSQVISIGVIFIINFIGNKIWTFHG